MQNFNNFSTLFIPFRFNSRFYDMVSDSLSESDGWIEEPIDLRYFFRFVANRVNGTDGRNRCRHFTVTKDRIPVLNTRCSKDTNSTVSVGEYIFGTFSFFPTNIELFVFMTGVCLIAIRTELDVSDTASLINARYLMRQVCSTKYRSEAVDKPFTLNDIARESVAELSEKFDLEFFYYTTPQNSIAYMMTLCYLDEDPDDMTLLYLQNNVALTHNLSPNLIQTQLHKISISDNIVWGVTGQSAICCCSRFEHDMFLHKVFPKNFRKEYTYLFVFLLHQKYALYSFLTQIDTELEKSVDKLEEYKKQLSDFKTYFVFLQISEVINYQLLYSEAFKALALEDMYEDVNEPLLMLDEILRREEEKQRVLRRIREEQAEKDQAVRDGRINLLLTVLSLLGLISAFVDSLELASKISSAASQLNCVSPAEFLGAHWIHLLIIVAVTVFSAIILIRLFRSRRSKKMKNNCLYIGVFYRKKEIEQRLKDIPRTPLTKANRIYHTTAVFMPEDIPFHLFGERVAVIVKGYGCDGNNEALLVELHSDNRELDELLSKIAVPHITLSVSENGRAKDSAGLTFSPIKAFELTGTFGEMTKNKRINTAKHL